jgi:hypothetical protein
MESNIAEKHCPWSFGGNEYELKAKAELSYNMIHLPAIPSGVMFIYLKNN